MSTPNPQTMEMMKLFADFQNKQLEIQQQLMHESSALQMKLMSSFPGTSGLPKDMLESGILKPTMDGKSHASTPDADRDHSPVRGGKGKGSKRKGKPKKQSATIHDITKMPAIDEAKLEELMPEIKTMIPEDFKWPMGTVNVDSGNGKTKKMFDIKCESLKLALSILRKKRDLLSKESSERCQKDGRWFACCGMALIVAIERKRIWDSSPPEPSDLVITAADVPPEAPLREGSAPVSVSKERKVRFSKQTTFQLWQNLVRSDPDTSAILSKYQFPVDYQILCVKWKPEKESGKKPTFKKPDSCVLVSEKTKQFLEQILPVEEWQRELEIIYARIEAEENKNKEPSAMEETPSEHIPEVAPASEQDVMQE